MKKLKNILYIQKNEEENYLYDYPRYQKNFINGYI